MPVHKRKYRSGQVVWYYQYDLRGSTRDGRSRISESGFSTKREAEEGEALKRSEERQRREMAKAGSVVAQIPKTLSMLLEEFFRQHVDKKLGAQDRRALPRAGGVPRP